MLDAFRYGKINKPLSPEEVAQVVNWNAKSQYASLAAIELARQYHANTPVQLKAISERLAMSRKFLVHVLIQLRSAGLVASTRGTLGGYQLARPPESISLWEVIQAVEPSGEVAGEGSHSPEREAVAQVVAQAQAAYHQVLRETSLADLLEAVNQQRDPMYFI